MKTGPWRDEGSGEEEEEEEELGRSVWPGSGGAEVGVEEQSKE